MRKLLLGLVFFAATGSGLAPAELRHSPADKGLHHPPLLLFAFHAAGQAREAGLHSTRGRYRGRISGHGLSPALGFGLQSARERGRGGASGVWALKDEKGGDAMDVGKEARMDYQGLRQSELGRRAGTKPRDEEDDEDDDELYADGALEGYIKKGDDEFHLKYSKEIHDFLAAPGTEITIAILVLTSCMLIAVETLTIERTFFIIEDTISFIFICEYLARWYSRQLNPRYLLRWGMVIDFIAILPFVLQLQTGNVGAMGLYTDYSFLRLLRILRLQRFLRDQASFQKLVGSILPVEVKVTELDLQLFRIFDQIFTLLFITSGLIYNAEKGLNDKLGDFFSAFYYTIITLTTVGFGDITPVTAWGRGITSGAILIGIALIPYQLSNLARIVLESEKERKERKEAKKEAQKKLRDTQEFVKVTCLTCGEELHAKRANFCLGCGTKLPGLEKEQEYM